MSGHDRAADVVHLDVRRRDFFPEGATGRRSFSPRRLADAALDRFDVGVLAGELLVRSDVAFMRDDVRLREFGLEALGDDWSPRRHAEFVATLAALAQELPDVPNPRLVPFRNGVIDAVTGEQRDHASGDLMTYSLAVDFDPAATCPAIDAFLADVLAPDFQTLAREIVGYCLTSWNALRAFAWLVGMPGTGKSTFTDLLRALVGTENVAAVQPHQLAESSFAGAALVGKLVNLVPDVSGADLRSVAALKSTTGDDLIMVERKFQAPVPARIYAKHVFASNSLPTFSDQTGAISARVKVLPFGRQTARPDDPHLRDKLTTPEELSGLALQGLHALYELRQRGSFTENASTRGALASFRSATNTIAAFVEECCTVGPDFKVKRADLWRAFTLWAEDARKGQKTGRNAFLATVRADHGLADHKSDGAVYLIGIGLTSPPMGFAS